MAIERTVSIIKPDAVGKNVIGKIYSRFEENGLKIVAAKMKQLTLKEAQEFYAIHKERPFYAKLVEFMTSGPVMIQILEGENAVLKNRELTVLTVRKTPPWKLPTSSAKPKSAHVNIIHLHRPIIRRHETCPCRLKVLLQRLSIKFVEPAIL